MIRERTVAISLSGIVLVYAFGAVLLVIGIEDGMAWTVLGVAVAVLGAIALGVRGVPKPGATCHQGVLGCREWREIWRGPVR